MALKTSDLEWKRDWKAITRIFESIEVLKDQFEHLDVSYLHELQQKILLLNLEKYAWSLQNYIIEKYGVEKNTDK
jgi:hypothetical protein